MSLRFQIGQFLLFIGLLFLVVFYVTDRVQSPNYLYCCSGLLVFVAGVYVMWLGRNPPAPDARFSKWRTLRQKRPKEKKKKEA